MDNDAWSSFVTFAIVPVLTQTFSIISGPLIKCQRTMQGETFLQNQTQICVPQNVAEFRFLAQLILYSSRKAVLIITLPITTNYLTRGEVSFLLNLVT